MTGFAGSEQTVVSAVPAAAISVFVFIISMCVSDVYRTLWIYSGTVNYLRIACFGMIAAVVSVIINAFVFPDVPVKLNAFACIMSLTEIIVLRMSVRGIYNLRKIKNNSHGIKKRLLIVGAGDAANMVFKDIANNKRLNYDIVGFIDDDKKKQKTNVNGIEVLGTRYAIPDICKSYHIEEILIAIPSAGLKSIREIIEICNNTECKIKILPSMDKIIDYENMHNNIRNVEIEDLLARDPIVLDNTGISKYIKNKTVLVTGGGGSIGSELCRQIMRYSPEKLIILDIYENNAYELQMELNKKYPDNMPEVVIASVRDADRLDDIFSKYKPYLVFHAAAHKHVPLMEESPGEAVKNNVFGTLNVVKCADKHKVKRFVMISTDKAVNPTNIMGATKRMCEMIVQCMARNSGTEFAAVRFGNVLGSNGSVIPLFKKQIDEGGPVTVTHKDITRFFMTIPEASQLVLQAASYAKGGEIFVLDMGEPVKIYDLAVNLIRLSGYRPNVDIEIKICGLRPGEKLYEEILMNEEGLNKTNHNKIFVGKPINIDTDKLNTMLDMLEKAVATNDNDVIKDAVAKAVPTYRKDIPMQEVI
ncbi:MAG: polysaccharide biosynthesis protein [Oscillospiraceae bacterium]|nr:polysaccharide biosynthesis protein [Oscillospiraceae bacterium]